MKHISRGYKEENAYSICYLYIPISEGVAELGSRGGAVIVVGKYHRRTTTSNHRRASDHHQKEAVPTWKIYVSVSTVTGKCRKKININGSDNVTNNGDYHKNNNALLFKLTQMIKMHNSLVFENKYLI